MSEAMIRPEAKSIGLSTYEGRKKQSLLASAKHNLREIQKEIGAEGHIDAARICLNEIITGPATAAEVEALAQTLRDAIGYRPPRKDFTQAHEIVFTLSSNTSLDTRKFFDFCLEFVVGEFGQGTVLSAVIHRDESAPHMHVLLIPIVDGQYVGSSLITKPSLAKLIDKFALVAQRPFGVIVERTLTGPMRAHVKKKVQEGLKSLLGQHISAELMEVIQKAAARNPAPFKAAMGITVGQLNDGGAEFRRIALSTGKGPKRERINKPYGFAEANSIAPQKPYGFESCAGDRKDIETILYVVSPKTPTFFPRTPPTCHGNYHRLTANPVGLFTRLIHSATTPTAGDDLTHLSTTRVKDADLTAETWDADTGEFVQATGSDRRSADPFSDFQVDQFQDDAESEVLAWND
jgi:hypothetical protein